MINRVGRSTQQSLSLVSTLRGQVHQLRPEVNPRSSKAITAASSLAKSWTNGLTSAVLKWT
jgi:hypothetical protein